VWAFGVTAWEILTEGAIPYFNIASDDNVIAHVCGGCRLKRNELSIACHDTLWDIISSCWAHAAMERPTFSRLVLQLGAALAPEEDQPFLLKVTSVYNSIHYEVEVQCTDTVAVLKSKLEVTELACYTLKPSGLCKCYGSHFCLYKNIVVIMSFL
jgi:hypothetical protein